MRRAAFLLCLAGLTGGLRATASPHVPQLRGTMTVGDQRLVSLVASEAHTQAWLRPGDRLGAFTVEAISSETVTVLDAAGARHVLRLPEAQTMNRQSPPADPIARRSWVNSRDNPMLHTPASLPVDFARWAELSAGRRQEIVAWYDTHGWKLDVIFSASGQPHPEFSPLQGDARTAIIAEKRAAFRRLLSPQQLTLYVAAHTAQTTNREHQLEKLQAALSPALRQAFTELDDFTTPLVKPTS